MNTLASKPELQQAADKKSGDLITVMLEERLERGSD